MPVSELPPDIDGVKTQTIAATSLHVRANRFDLLSRLADDLAHEIKNPLHAAVINLELLKRRIQTGQLDEAIHRVHILDEEIARVHDLFDWLARLLRPSQGEAQVLDLNQLIGEMIPPLQVLARLYNISVDWSPAGEPCTSLVKRGSIRHAFLNLVVNAFDSIAPREGRIEIDLTGRGPEICLRVRDSGSGIAPEALSRIGTPGFSTRQDRHGLGLAVAHTLVEEAGGRIDIESAGGKAHGAAIVIVLPRAT